MILLKSVICRSVCNRVLLSVRTAILSDVRKLKTKENSKSSNDGFINLYRLPSVHVFGIINRLKWYFTLYCGISVPTSLVLEQMNIIESSFPVIYTSLGTCVVFYSVGTLVNKLVGLMYVNIESETVKLSYLDFWGKRKNIECSMQDIKPLSTPKFSKLLPYKYIHRNSTEEVLKLYAKPEMILNDGLFCYIFGDIN